MIKEGVLQDAEASFKVNIDYLDEELSKLQVLCRESIFTCPFFFLVSLLHPGCSI